jgi:hypothetical protein
MFGLHPDAWSAIAAWVALLVLGASAAFAYIQIREARRLREEEARPVVVVDFDVDRRPHIIYLAYENFGRTTAHDVKVTFDPPLTSKVADGDYVHFFSNTFPTLAPGKRIASVFDSAIQRLSSDLPKQYEATASYTDRNGRRYEDKYLLDLSVLEGRLTANEKDVGNVVDALTELARTVKAFRSSYGGVSVVTMTAEDAKEARDGRFRQAQELSDRLTSGDELSSFETD